MEIWKTVFIKGIPLPSYEVSSFGRVRSLSPSNRIKSKEGLLTIHKRSAYPQVVLSPSKGVRITARVHRVVAEAFLGLSNLHVNHIDGNKSNNRADNLEYVTPAGNIAHAKRLGLRRFVNRNCLITKTKNGTRGNKLTFTQAQEIRARVKSGLSMRKVALMFGITHQTVSDIVARKFWNEAPIGHE